MAIPLFFNVKNEYDDDNEHENDDNGDSNFDDDESDQKHTITITFKLRYTYFRVFYMVKKDQKFSAMPIKTVVVTCENQPLSWSLITSAILLQSFPLNCMLTQMCIYK